MINKETILKLIELTESRLVQLKALIENHNTNGVELRIAANDVVTPINIVVDYLDENDIGTNA